MVDNHDRLIALMEQNDWEEILRVTQGITEPEASAPALAFFARGKALLAVDRAEEALPFATQGRVQSPTESWGMVLLFDILISLGRSDEALAALAIYIGDYPAVSEPLRRLYVENALSAGRWQLASSMNETRAALIPDQPTSYAVAVQCFNKTDTLDMLLAALVRCRGTEHFNLVIYQDSVEGSPKADKYAPASAEVRAVIAKWLPSLMDRFRTVEINRGTRNRGTAPTCRQLLDFVSSRYQGFVFLEDDCILTEDALLWARFHLQHNIGMDKYWFATCESIFFDSGSLSVPDIIKQKMQEYAGKDSVSSSYVELNFVPSTCFITTREIWEKSKGVRSFPHGPESLNKYVEHLSKKTLSPVVPRARDIGMLHELGYSVAMLGKDNVKEIKNTYVTSEGLFDPDKVRMFTGNRDKLWLTSCKMDEKYVSELLAD